MSQTAPTDAELISRYHSGTLIDVLEVEPVSDRHDSLRNRLIALHNGGQINLLAAIETPGFQSLRGSDFFSVQRVYCTVIPHLQAPAQEMRQAVSKLVTKGG